MELAGTESDDQGRVVAESERNNAVHFGDGFGRDGRAGARRGRYRV